MRSPEGTFCVSPRRSSYPVDDALRACPDEGGSTGDEPGPKETGADETGRDETGRDSGIDTAEDTVHQSLTIAGYGLAVGDRTCRLDRTEGRTHQEGRATRVTTTAPYYRMDRDHRAAARGRRRRCAPRRARRWRGRARMRHVRSDGRRVAERQCPHRPARLVAVPTARTPPVRTQPVQGQQEGTPCFAITPPDPCAPSMRAKP